MTALAPEIQQQWSAIAPILTIRNEQDYDQSIARLNELLDEVGTNEAHPLYTLLDTLGLVIQAYEDTHYASPDCSGTEVLAYLMEEHDLTSIDLPELGSSEAIAEILSGQKPLDVYQIQVLSKRFNVSPSVFI